MEAQSWRKTRRLSPGQAAIPAAADGRRASERPVGTPATVSCICCHCSMKKTICHSVGNATEIVYGIKLRRRLTPLLNVACDSQNISST